MLRSCRPNGTEGLTFALRSVTMWDIELAADPTASAPTRRRPPRHGVSIAPPGHRLRRCGQDWAPDGSYAHPICDRNCAMYSLAFMLQFSQGWTIHFLHNIMGCVQTSAAQ